ncbi:MAG: PD-(D/E)XK nuclease family protein [Deltaproteobacteria bacterium]|nr:PD-(D/E)XK nuclease family protein [Deltaproteobacteria bacterium]MBZ0219562.1 PD-(D/E)XK nuclease family protein [Deltaproteobacteria bacterium]
MSAVKYGRVKRLIASMEKGAVVLTANSRLSRHLRAAFDREMAERGLLCWPTPEVLPFSSWTASFWEERGEGPVLGSAASLALWERSISASGPGNGNLGSAVVRKSYEAYGFVNEYGITLPEEIYLTEEAKALKRWAAAYENELKRLGFLDPSSIPVRVAGLIRKGGHALPAEVIIAGFDEMSPADSGLVFALKAVGTRVSFWPGEDDSAPGEVRVRAYESEDEEAEQAARWAREVLKPGMRLGFIVPGLGRYREAILKEFSSELSPASVLPWAGEREAFNISLGEPLDRELLVRSALDILLIGEKETALDSISGVLRSPYFTGGDSVACARLDYALRNENRGAVNIEELEALARRFGAVHLEKRADAWIKWLKSSRRKDLPSGWARSFTDLLRKTGWLSGIKLSSREFQAHKAWNSVLEKLSSLDDILGRITRAEAAQRLAALAADTIHQPETPECNIQVLGLLESSGMSFDRAWIMGCHEHVLPGEPSPNPFIPVWVQREHRLPRSSSERELSFAKAAVERLVRSAPFIEVSYPIFSDEKERRVSPFFSSFPLTDFKMDCSSKLEDHVAGGLCGRLEDAPAYEPLPVSEEEKALIRGGTQILKNQSLCPFRAFAIHRLGAKAMPEVEPGLKPEARGRVIHAALKLFWEKVEGSERLKELKEEGGLEAYIEAIADEAMKEASVQLPFSTRFLELERKRLISLLRGWIEVELKREGRFRVKAIEAERTMEIGGLTFRGRVDRIDELSDGSELVIDYKSGNVSRYDWLTERPKEPQLLIYSAEGNFSGVSFARLVPGELRFVGISKYEGLPGIKPYETDAFFRKKAGKDWEGLIEFWKAALEGLARDFMAGAAQIDPNGGTAGNESACLYCELPAFCRVAELLPVVLEEGENERNDDQ